MTQRRDGQVCQGDLLCCGLIGEVAVADRAVIVRLDAFSAAGCFDSAYGIYRMANGGNHGRGLLDFSCTGCIREVQAATGADIMGDGALGGTAGRLAFHVACIVAELFKGLCADNRAAILAGYGFAACGGAGGRSCGFGGVCMSAAGAVRPAAVVTFAARHRDRSHRIQQQRVLFARAYRASPCPA